MGIKARKNDVKKLLMKNGKLGDVFVGLPMDRREFACFCSAQLLTAIAITASPFLCRAKSKNVRLSKQRSLQKIIFNFDHAWPPDFLKKFSYPCTPILEKHYHCRQLYGLG